MNLIIRRATRADAEVICDFNRQMARETEGKDLDPAILQSGVLAMLSDSHKGSYFVAESDEQVVGQLGITLEWSDWRNGNFWWIQSVYVAASARRQGVFRKLYQHVLQSARAEANVIGVRLYVEHDNQVAQATYRKMGMVMTRYQVMEEVFGV
ncbi:MAG: GNAT family N-acetyltransferase [Gemmataceae bacterium]|nr:GNAT family N-acetyltransferase [Gemmataceae bacterium]